MFVVQGGAYPQLRWWNSAFALIYFFLLLFDFIWLVMVHVFHNFWVLQLSLS